MAAQNQDFSMYSGETKNLIVTIKEKNGEIVNLNGANIVWAIKGSLNNDVNIVSKSTDDGIITEDQENGRVRIRLNPEDTENIRGKYYHICKITDGVGNVSIVLTGTVEIKSDGM